MERHFLALADHLQALTRSDEVSLAWLSAEESDFIRFNHTLVRQAMHVRQAAMGVALVHGQRRLDASFTLSGNLEDDLHALAATFDGLRDSLPQVPEDPWLLYATERHDSRSVQQAQLPAPGMVIDRVLEAGSGHDLVGLYAAGPVYRGFANSLGQRNWHEVAWFDIGFSLYHAADKAVKTSYAGSAWDDRVFGQKVAAAGLQLERLAQPPRKLEPGHYRALFQPAAMAEFLGALAWGGFGAKAQRTRQNTLGRLHDGQARLSAAVSMREMLAGGSAPAFQGEGFVRPERVSLIETGRSAGLMVSPRSQREYGLPHNGANNGEMPEALELLPGTLPPADALRALGTGILVGNLWYLNYSDRQACRLTGMTRFATFWVEDGEIRAPLDVMRFDDTIYRILGTELEALTSEAELVPDGDSYGGRSTRSVRTPSALVRDFCITL